MGPNYALQQIKTTTHQVWKDVFESWQQFCECFGNHNASTDILKSILWCIENIQIDPKNPYFYKNYGMRITFLGVNTFMPPMTNYW